ncbi:MAG: hypothetical protein V1698_00745 [bacterium]
MEKEKYFDEEKNIESENIADQGSVEKKKIKSRLSLGWGKLKEKFKQPLQKNVRKAVVLSSVAFTMLSASEGMALSHKELVDTFRKDENKYELVLGEKQLQQLEVKEYKDLFSHTEEVDQKINPEKITTEFSLMNEISESLNKQYKERNGSAGSFDLSQRAYDKIEEANEIFERINKLPEEEKNKFRAKVFEEGNLNWINAFKIFFVKRALENIALIPHELGHQSEASVQGVETKGVNFNFGIYPAGFCGLRGLKKAKNPELIDSAGINSSNNMSEFI